MPHSGGGKAIQTSGVRTMTMPNGDRLVVMRKDAFETAVKAARPSTGKDAGAAPRQTASRAVA